MGVDSERRGLSTTPNVDSSVRGHDGDNHSKTKGQGLRGSNHIGGRWFGRDWLLEENRVKVGV